MTSTLQRIQERRDDQKAGQQEQQQGPQVRAAAA
jgi:hypothetical protein